MFSTDDYSEQLNVILMSRRPNSFQQDSKTNFTKHLYFVSDIINISRIL